jgi:hypothetical protein
MRKVVTLTGVRCEMFISFSSTVFHLTNFFLLQVLVNGRLTGLVTFCVETATYDRLLKEM